MTKTQAAFILSAEKLFELGARVYFWTFTFREVWPDWWYPSVWRCFTRDLGNLYGGNYCGVRVLEPAEHHGLHYHCLINRRMNIHLIRRIGAKYGMHIIKVKRCGKREGVIRYLLPYLNPLRCGITPGMRRWGTMGAFIGVKVNNIIVETPYMDWRRRRVGRSKVPFGYEVVTRRAFELGGEERADLCYKYVTEGRLASAAALASPNVELTAAGGVKYKGRPQIPFKVAFARGVRASKEKFLRRNNSSSLPYRDD